jgi:hypothetical protein
MLEDFEFNFLGEETETETETDDVEVEVKEGTQDIKNDDPTSIFRIERSTSV